MVRKYLAFWFVIVVGALAACQPSGGYDLEAELPVTGRVVFH